MRMLIRRLAAETAGTLVLLATVVGSGIMAERLAGGNVAIALLGNTLATGAMLVVLITMLAPLSGAHFNPAVSLLFVIKRQLSPVEGIAYVAAQVIGAVVGVWLAHAMFGEAIIQVSHKLRSGPAQALSEGVATFGLILTIFATHQARRDFVPVAVGLYITAAYWFTASTSFANPAVTVARSLTDTFSGIRPADAPIFITAQIVGALLALVFCDWLLKPQEAVI
ncbi:MAG: MIP/aquaporin family protein [Asticcacaulis sp.]|uniref:MIP/aquaporin family protein n=1 Tax=Asticcacaulis sp. TaxID=1872648 RepID=UPI003F7C97C8